MITWRKSLLAGALCTSMLFSGCDQPKTSTYTSSAGSLALSRGDELLYVVDSDNDALMVVDTQTEAKLAQVKVGRSPERVVVGPDDTIYVSNRGDRSVSVIRKGEWGSVQKIQDVGVEPVGLAVSPDNKNLYVVSSTSLDDASVGTVTAIDVATLTPKWVLPVGHEPRGIALLEDGKKALVSLYKDGDVVLVDLENQVVIKNNAVTRELHRKANFSRSTRSGVAFSTFAARAAADVVATPDGQRAFMPAILAREDAITTRPNTFGGYYAQGGPCNIGAVASPAIVTYETADAEPLADDLTACSFSTNSEAKDFPPTTLAPQVAGRDKGIQGPVAAVVDPTGAWLFVVNRESQNVAIMPTARRTDDKVDFNASGSTVRELVNLQLQGGHGLNGIALTRDGSKAYVYAQFDHKLHVLEAIGVGSDSEVKVKKSVTLADPVFPAEVEMGRKMFFNAMDERISSANTRVACSSCHLEGRDDGHVWGFPDGVRQTPSLAGRQLSATAPFHWSGEFATLGDFMDHTVGARMGGSGLSATAIAQMQRFIESLPAPDNPHRTAQPTEAQIRGRAAFEKAGCNSCHASETLTNNANANVGTLHPTDKVTALNTPSLLTLSRTAPYLHTGAAGTIRARLQADRASSRHGNLAALSDAELNDLEAYLKSL